MKYIIKCREIYTPQGLIRDSDILVDEEKIIGVGLFNGEECEVIDLGDYKVLPGLIDTHIHGCNGYDTMDANYIALNEMSMYLASIGVTSFLATTVTSYLEKIEKAIENVADCVDRGLKGSRLLGSYIEGPYITEKYKGAHPEELIRELNIKEIDRIIEKSRNTVKIITIAPEKPMSIEIIKYLTSKGIKVSLGHTNSTYEEAICAINGGASIAVHIYNGMRGLHHREAGMLGAALNRDDIRVELICDGIHVSPPAMQIVLKCKQSKDIILITDCMMAGGLKDGNYTLGELRVKMEEGIVKTKDGSLAGSTLKLINGIKNMHEMVGASLEEAINMATINPAASLGLDLEIGSIEKDKLADIIAIDNNYNTVFTMVNGKIVFTNLGGISNTEKSVTRIAEGT